MNKFGLLIKLQIIVFFLGLISIKAFQEDANITTDSLTVPDSVNMALKPRIGIFGHLGYNFHYANFTNLPSVFSCCPEFTGGSGSGFSFGGLYEYPLNEKLLLSLRAGFSVYDGSMSSKEAETLIIDGKSQIGYFEHKLDFNLGSIGIEPMVAYSFYPNTFVHGGLRIGLLSNSYFEQIEEIVEPADRGTFINGSRTRNHQFGEITDVSSVMFGVSFGISHELIMDKKESLLLVPELFYTMNLTPAVSGIDWNVHQIHGGVAIKYRQPPPPPAPPLPPLNPPSAHPPLPPAPPALFAEITAIEVDSLGNEKKDFNIRIEDFVSHNMRPLLNYIFFEVNSAEIPKRYIKLKPENIDNFTMKNLQNLDALKTYYQVLNIIGMRMKQNADAKIDIVGCNSDTGDEKNNKDLSRDRAIAVRDYLRDVWGIDGTRMPIKFRNLPEKHTRNDEPGGEEENRRVEILSDDLRITEPVMTADTMRVLATSKVRFVPKAQTSVGIKNWSMSATHDSKELISFSGDGKPDEKLDWQLNDKNSVFPKTNTNIFYSLNVTDSLGQTFSTTKNRLPVERLTIDRKRLERISDMEFEYYSLILFDFGKSDLRNEHRRVVDFVKERVTDKARVYIKGYTDIMGETEINKRISEKRAKSVADRLKIKQAQVEGIGKDQLLYDNSTPEGRFYCRTVQIIIETPVEE